MTSSSNVLSDWPEELSRLTEAYGAVAYSLLQVCRLCSRDTMLINNGTAIAFDHLAKRVARSGEELGDELSTLSSMAHAVQAVGEADPKAGVSVLLNMLSVLFSVVQNVEREFVEEMEDAKDEIVTLRNASAASFQSSVPSASSVASASVLPLDSSASPGRSTGSGLGTAPSNKSVPTVLQNNVDSDSDHANHATPGANVADAPKKKKKVKGSSKKKETVPDFADAPPILSPALSDAEATAEKQVVKKKKSVKHVIAAETEEVSPKKSPVTAEFVTGSTSVSNGSSSVVGATPKINTLDASFAKDRQPWDPDFLRITTCVADALGPLIKSSRPDVFSPPEQLMAYSVVQQYFIELQPAGRLAPLCLRCWINVEEGIAQDFSRDVLDVDHVEIEPFNYIGQQIRVTDENDVRGLPACGWRQVFSEDHSKKLFTSYMFVNNLRNAQRSLLVHDVVIDEHSKMEVLTVATILSHHEAKYARVRVFASNQGSVSKLAQAITTMTKDVFAHYGFDEVDEEVAMEGVTNANDPLIGSSEVLPLEEKMLQAELPPGQADPSLFKETKKKKTALERALGIGKSIALAPVTATKAVSNIVANAAESAMLSQTDARFQEWFPTLAAEVIIDTFNCALADGSLLNQGVLFVTSRWLAFHATVLTKQFMVDFDELQDIRKEKTMKIFDNAVELETFSGAKYFLTSFVSRDAAFTTIHKAWRTSGR